MKDQVDACLSSIPGEGPTYCVFVKSNCALASAAHQFGTFSKFLSQLRYSYTIDSMDTLCRSWVVWRTGTNPPV